MIARKSHGGGGGWRTTDFTGEKIVDRARGLFKRPLAEVIANALSTMDVEIELGAGIGENVMVVMHSVLEMEAAYDERMSTQWTDMAFGLYR